MGFKSDWAIDSGVPGTASTSWWQRANDVNAANKWGATALQAPSDWSDFRKNYGGGFAKSSDYENWRLGQQRERAMSDFVDRMATEDQGTADYTARMNGNFDKDRGNLDSYLAQQGPQMDTSNRFEAGLAGNERRLNALLDDPNSVQQTAAYKFRLKQGEDAIQRQMGAKGLLNSGNRLLELTKYGQDMGSQEYDNQANRLKDLVGMFSGNWVGDKNANTQKFSAQSNAWNQRGNMLADIYGKSQQGVTSSAKLNTDNRLGWANAWTNQAPKAQQWSVGSV